MAGKALEEATSAWDQYGKDEREESKKSAKIALEFLNPSIEEAPFEKQTVFFAFTEDMADE
ncbi:hypothetical protein VTN00DRAFT_2525 [Thermoascus crustaceus]|uniref:uncharacterized protein n=1 Tax=Thermoascus crustaceus TaxID=5088 RepID=UPI003742F39E